MIEFMTEEELKKARDKIILDIVGRNIVDSDNIVRDSLGRAWTLKDWASREFKTSIANDLLDNTLNLMKEYEYDLVFVSYLGDSSDLCSDYQNKVYSISGNSEKYPPLDDALWENGGGLLHPNCRHFIDPYFPGETKLENDTQGKKEINKQKEIRNNFVNTSKQVEKWEQKLARAKITNIDVKKYEQKVEVWNDRLSKLPQPNDASFTK